MSATDIDADGGDNIESGDDDTGTRRSFETRWSGVLEREGSSETGESNDDADERRWRFVQMHVSAPHEL